eukprot:Phypoly_transcript_10173.p4 GENE.Phypoly_transcript_10173~~Phypoly_transcript_10173.p4  ORF type:complete len:114 (-),score=21.73 Phypoly_transcript_10173:288-629(-)
MSKGCIGTPRAALSSYHSRGDEDNGEDGRNPPTCPVKPVDGNLCLLPCTHPEVQGYTCSPEEGRDKEKVDSCSEELAQIQIIRQFIIGMQEEEDLADAYGQASTKIGHRQEED